MRRASIAAIIARVVEATSAVWAPVRALAWGSCLRDPQIYLTRNGTILLGAFACWGAGSGKRDVIDNGNQILVQGTGRA